MSVVLPFLILVLVIYLIIYITVKVSRSRKDIENERIADSQRQQNRTAVPRVRQTYVISPIYTIERSNNNNEGSLDPIPYETAMHMSTATCQEKSNDEGLPTYDEALVFSKPVENSVIPTVPTHVIVNETR